MKHLSTMENKKIRFVTYIQTPPLGDLKPIPNIPSIKKLCEQHKRETGKDFYNENLFIENRDDFNERAKLFDALVPPGGKPNFHIITSNYMTGYKENGMEKYHFAMRDYKPDDFEYLVTFMIAAPQLASGNPTWAYKYSYHRFCSACGNKPYATEVPSDFKFKRLPKKQSRFEFYPPYLNFAREKFVKAYEKSGLTGLSFDPMPEGLFLIKVAKHRWNDRTGVCDQCEMKTNVIMESFFNLPEKYLYDIQFAETNTCGYLQSPAYIVSPAAFRFLKWDMTACSAPILPGYMSDLIWPAPRMFTNGTYPTTVYREK